MRPAIFRSVLSVAAVVCALMASACGALPTKYEYEEEIYLRLDGSATVNVNASVASLVALHGVDLPVDPRKRVDRGRVRELFQGSGAEVTRVTLSRRHGRRFVHVGMEVPDVRQLHRLPMFSWSTYGFERRGDVFEYHQQVGGRPSAAVGDVGWTGDELVLFKMHIPSEIPYHNSPSRRTERGNILQWDQPLTERLRGVPIDVQVRMEPESILYTTLILFGLTIVAAAITFGVVLWWLVRRGRESEELPSTG
jgi:hypothetical protein